jgi:FAD:protein FMN transferase
MGMPIAIDVADPNGVDVEPVFDWLREVDATFSTYRDDSDISRLDRGELTLAQCRPAVDEVLTRCLALQRDTDGFFSVRAAGRLDPSGFVKGWAIDGAAERLAAAGIQNF